MALTPKQTAIHELMVKRQEVVMDIQALRKEYERKSPGVADNDKARKILNAEYAAEMRTREKIRDGINSKLAGETPLGRQAMLGPFDWLPPAPLPPDHPDAPPDPGDCLPPVEPPPGDPDAEPGPTDPEDVGAAGDNGDDPDSPPTGLNADGVPVPAVD